MRTHQGLQEFLLQEGSGGGREEPELGRAPPRLAGKLSVREAGGSLLQGLRAGRPALVGGLGGFLGRGHRKKGRMLFAWRKRVRELRGWRGGDSVGRGQGWG